VLQERAPPPPVCLAGKEWSKASHDVRTEHNARARSRPTFRRSHVRSTNPLLAKPRLGNADRSGKSSRDRPHRRRGLFRHVIGVVPSRLRGSDGGVQPKPAVTSTASPSLAPTTSAPASVDPAALGVVRGWLDAQNAGDLEKAATFFAPGARLGGSGLVTTHNVAEIVAVLEPLAVCHHEIVGARSMAGAIFVAVELSGPNCTFLVGGETTHEIEIPVQIADGKITCTCPPGASRQPSPGVRA
jgi:hypothetical protein